MNKQFVAPKDGPKPVGPYSPGVLVNGFLFVSGQIPLNPGTGQMAADSFAAQARQTLENLKSVVEAAGAALDDAVKVTIYLTDLKNFAELNSIYEEYFSQGKPARACIQAAALPKGADIEIDAIVAVK
ncbi:MAG: Rid family detoxifying hydrolase [Candidatus Omnitrophota bacterium]